MNSRWAIGIVGAALAFSGSCRPAVETRVARILEWERRPTERNVERIRQALTDRDAPVRAGALAALGRLMTPDAKERARAALADPDGGVRATAVIGLLDLSDAQAVPLLVRVALEDPDWRARRGAVEAAGKLAAEGTVPELAGALDDASWQVRLAAIAAVTRLGAPSAVERLAKLSGSENSWEVRAAAAEALGRSKVPEAYVPARAALLDPNEFVRAAASGAIRELRRANVPEPAEEPPPPSPVGPMLPGQRPPKQAPTPATGARR